MMKFLTRFFTWWNGQTFNTQFYTWRKGERVGEDEFGNVYYQGGKDAEGRTRRWVIYNGYSEASAIPPGWHGWMHHRVDTPPTQEDYKPREWQKPHKPNLTGTCRRLSSAWLHVHAGKPSRSSPATTTPGPPANKPDLLGRRVAFSSRFCHRLSLVIHRQDGTGMFSGS
jgi:NADH:ubiquinone oxidoreductase subunit